MPDVQRCGKCGSGWRTSQGDRSHSAIAASAERQLGNPLIGLFASAASHYYHRGDRNGAARPPHTKTSLAQLWRSCDGIPVSGPAARGSLGPALPRGDRSHAGSAPVAGMHMDAHDLLDRTAKAGPVASCYRAAKNSSSGGNRAGGELKPTIE